MPCVTSSLVVSKIFTFNVQGTKSGQDEQIVAARKTVELDDSLDGMAVQVSIMERTYNCTTQEIITIDEFAAQSKFGGDCKIKRNVDVWHVSLEFFLPVAHSLLS